jgi:hypothetical protein
MAHVLSKAQRRVLETLRDAEDANEKIDTIAACDKPEYDENDEIVCCGVECWIGMTRISHATVNTLLRLVSISDVSDANGGARRYRINETGRNILADESQISVLVQSLHEGGAWTWREGRLVRM